MCTTKSNNYSCYGINSILLPTLRRLCVMCFYKTVRVFTATVMMFCSEDLIVCCRPVQSFRYADWEFPQGNWNTTRYSHFHLNSNRALILKPMNYSQWQIYFWKNFLKKSDTSWRKYSHWVTKLFGRWGAEILIVIQCTVLSVFKKGAMLRM